MIASVFSDYLADGANMVAIVAGGYGLCVFIDRNKERILKRVRGTPSSTNVALGKSRQNRSSSSEKA